MPDILPVAVDILAKKGDGNHITILIDLIEQEDFVPVTVEADIEHHTLMLKWPTRMFGLDYALVTMEYR